uniref:deoxyribose-phosphate aldolase n=1 Tax=Plectus sambesii TaxID=2011161 RepID=A0A914XDF7_9BILA
MVFGITAAAWIFSFGPHSSGGRRQFDSIAFDRQTSKAHFDDKIVKDICEGFQKHAKTLLDKRPELASLITYIDLTTLAGDDTPLRVHGLVDKALEPLDATIRGQLGTAADAVHCGAVCVYPARVADVVNRLKQHRQGNRIGIASVAAGFPSGQYRLESRLLEIQLAVQDGATEIDIVINRAAALGGDWKTVHDEVRDMKIACGPAHMKTILATGELQTNDNIYKASWASMMAGSDFIKTSTGKETVNATLPVSYVMCRAIKDFYEQTGIRVGFKPAGGIRTTEEALAFRCLIEEVLGKEWLTPKLFRIGASSLLGDIETSLRNLTKA